MEFVLADTGMIMKEDFLCFQELFEIYALLGGLQSAENKRSHHQVQHDPRQQGQEGGAPHFLPNDPPAPPGLQVRA